jgi:hypothetical protein
MKSNLNVLQMKARHCTKSWQRSLFLSWRVISLRNTDIKHVFNCILKELSTITKWDFYPSIIYNSKQFRSNLNVL